MAEEGGLNWMEERGQRQRGEGNAHDVVLGRGEEERCSP